MNCEEIQEYLMLYPDDVPENVKQKIDEHLSGCSECKAILASYKLYQDHIENESEENISDDFNDKLFKRIEREDDSPVSVRYKLTYLAVAAAASIMIIFALYNQIDNEIKKYHDVSFSLQLEKRGKGPSGSVDFKSIDKKIKEIVSETYASLEFSNKNDVTGYYDHCLVSIPRNKFASFIEQFNKYSALPIGDSDFSENGSSQINLKISFDMINFVTGNFDGDGKADILVQFLSGKNKMKWVIYKNDSTSFYENILPVKFENEEKVYGDNWLISGDYNGDGYDDLFIYNYNAYNKFSYTLLQNKKDLSFTETKSNYNIVIPGKAEFVSFISSDSDGDGTDEIICIERDEEFKYYLTELKLNKTYAPIDYPGKEDTFIFEIAGDFNGDGLFDLLLKPIEGKGAGQTYYCYNNGDYTFTEIKKSRMSFQGDYIIWADDFDGDGKDEMAVKDGGWFIPGTWYIYPDHLDWLKDGKNSFKLVYPWF